MPRKSKPKELSLKERGLVRKKWLVTGKKRLTWKGKKVLYQKMTAKIGTPILTALYPSLTPLRRNRILDLMVKSTRPMNRPENKGAKKSFIKGRMQSSGERHPTIALARWEPVEYGTIAHEIAHWLWKKMKYPGFLNDFVVANAYGPYFQVVLSGKKWRKGLMSDEGMDRATREGAYLRSNTPRFLDVLDEKITYGHTGGYLAGKALEIEEKLGKPGAGLFFINGVCMGRNWREVRKELEDGSNAGFEEWRKKFGSRWKKLS